MAEQIADLLKKVEKPQQPQKQLTDKEKLEIAESSLQALTVGTMSIIDAYNYYKSDIKPFLDKINSLDADKIEAFASEYAEKLKAAIDKKIKEEKEVLKRKAIKEGISLAKEMIPPKTIRTRKALYGFEKQVIVKKKEQLYKEAQDEAIKRITDYSDKLDNLEKSITGKVTGHINHAGEIVGPLLASYNTLLKNYKLYEEYIVRKDKEQRDRAKIKGQAGKKPKIISDEKAKQIRATFNSATDTLEEELAKLLETIYTDVISQFEEDVYGKSRFQKSGMRWADMQPKFFVEFACMPIVVPMIVNAVSLLISGCKSKNDVLFQEGIEKYKYCVNFCDWCANRFDSQMFGQLSNFLNPLRPIINAGLEHLFRNIRINKEYVANRGARRCDDLRNSLKKGLDDQMKDKKEQSKDLLAKIISDSLNENKKEDTDKSLGKSLLKDPKNSYVEDVLEPSGSEIIDRLNLLLAGRDIIKTEELVRSREAKRAKLIKISKEMTKPGTGPSSNNRFYGNKVTVQDLLKNADPCLPIEAKCPEPDKEEENLGNGDCIDAIIEFDYTIKEYKWFVGPGDTITSDTVLGYYVDKDNNGKLYKRKVISPFSSAYIDKKIYKVLDKDFKRHYLFKCVTFKDLDKDEQERLEKEANKIQGSIDNVMEYFKRYEEMESFITNILFKYFITEKIKRCRGNEPLVKAIYKDVEQFCDIRASGIKKDCEDLKNGLKMSNFNDAQLKSTAARAYALKYEYAKYLYRLWRTYSRLSVVEPPSRIDSSLPVKNKKTLSKISNTHNKTMWAIHDLLFAEESDPEISDDIKRYKKIANKFGITKELVFPEEAHKKVLDIDALKVFKFLNQEAGYQKYSYSEHGDGVGPAILTELTQKDIRSGKYRAFLYDKSNNPIEEYDFKDYQDQYKDLVNVYTRAKFEGLDDKIEEILKTYLKNQTSLDDAQKFIETEFKDFLETDKNLYLDFDDFFDLDILGTVYPYHLISGYERAELRNNVLDDLGLGDHSGSEYDDVSDDDFNIALKDPDGELKDLGLELSKQQLHEEKGLAKLSSQYSYRTYRYWLRHLLLDTVCGLPNLVKWFATPLLMLPVIYLPIIVFTIPILKCICVIGVGIAGLGTYPMIIIVNTDSKNKSWLVPITFIAEMAYKISKFLIATYRKALIGKAHTQENLLRKKIVAIDMALKSLDSEEIKNNKDIEEHIKKIYKDFEYMDVEYWKDKARKAEKQYDDLKESYEETKKDMKDGFKNAKKEAKEKFEDLKKSAENSYNEAKQTATDAFNNAEKRVTSAVDRAEKEISYATKNIEDSLKKIVGPGPKDNSEQEN